MAITITKPAVNISERLSNLDGISLENFKAMDATFNGTVSAERLTVNHSVDTAARFTRTSANTYRIEHDLNQFYFWNETTSEAPLIFQNDGDVIMNAGNLLVGKSSASARTTAGHEIWSTGFSRSTVDNNKVVEFIRTSGPGEIIVLYEDQNPVGSIDSHSGGFLKIATAGDQSGLLFGTSAIYPIKNSVITPDAVDLGDSSERFRDLYLSGGVVFPDAGGTGTSSSNKLDSYEEGTWTPVLSDASSGGNTATIATSLARYTKIGNIVTVTARIQDINTSGMTSSNALYIQGLPFTSNNTTTSAGSLVVDRIGTSGNQLNPYIGLSTTVLLIQESYAAAGSQDSSLLVSAIGATGSDIQALTITYEAA